MVVRRKEVETIKSYITAAKFTRAATISCLVPGVGYNCSFCGGCWVRPS